MAAEIKTYRFCRNVAAAKFDPKDNVIPIVYVIPDDYFDEMGRPAKRSSYWVDIENHSYRLNGGEWVVWDPLAMVGMAMTPSDEDFRRLFTEVSI